MMKFNTKFYYNVEVYSAGLDLVSQLICDSIEDADNLIESISNGLKENGFPNGEVTTQELEAIPHGDSTLIPTIGSPFIKKSLDYLEKGKYITTQFLKVTKILVNDVGVYYVAIKNPPKLVIEDPYLKDKFDSLTNATKETSIKLLEGALTYLKKGLSQDDDENKKD